MMDLFLPGPGEEVWDICSQLPDQPGRAKDFRGGGANMSQISPTALEGFATRKYVRCLFALAASAQ